ncbi:MAG TPA: glycosyltransferase family 4 protein [Steroidobacteraceae bacterium]
MPSVLHICTDFWPSTGGIERFVLDLATRSDSIGLTASILCFDRVKSHPGQLPRKETVCGIAVTRIPFVDLKFYKPAVLPLQLLRQHDVLHVHGPGALLDFAVLTKWLHRKPIVLSTHGGLFHTRTLLLVKRIYFFGLQPTLMRFVDAVAACSKTDAALFRRIADRVVLVENAVDTSMYLALSRDRQRQGRCLYVGRLSDNKGIPDLLRAFAAAKQRGAVFELRLVGRDENGNRARYIELARTLGIEEWVAFLGAVDQEGLLREYQCAQVFVSASRYEGFGLSAIEAKAAGCQLVLNANAAFSDIFSSDKAAILTDFTNAESTAPLLVAVLQGDSTMSNAVRREVEAYSWQRKLGEWRSLYMQCVRQRRPAP